MALSIMQLCVKGEHWKINTHAISFGNWMIHLVLGQPNKSIYIMHIIMIDVLDMNELLSEHYSHV